MRALNQSGEPNTDGKQLIYRPEHSAAASLQQGLKWIYLDLSVRWVGERFTTEANTKSLSPYQRWDAGIGKRFNLTGARAKLDLLFEVRNIFNRNYRIIEAAPTPLREFWLSIALEYR
jgi:outer membrane cobalamin receptor